MTPEEFWTTNKPHLSANSHRSYTSTTKKLMTLMDEEFNEGSIDSMVNKRFDLFTLIGNYNINTAKNYYNVMCEMCRVGYTGENKPSILEDIIEHRNAASDIYRQGVQAHKYTEKQQDKIINWEEVLSVRLTLEQDVKRLHIRKKITHDKNLTDAELGVFQDLVLVSLYTHLPPVRNDYAFVKVITPNNYSALSKDERMASNWLLVAKGWMEIRLHQFKTSKVYGEIVLPVPKSLKLLLRYWLRINGSGILLLNRNNEPLSENGISKYLTRIFVNHTGKKVSSTMLRHIFLSSEFGEEIRKELEGYSYKKDIADSMGHSVATQKYYVKVAD